MWRKMSHYGIGISFSLALLVMAATAGLAQGDLPPAPNPAQVGFRLDRLSAEQISTGAFPSRSEAATLMLADYIVTKIDPLPGYERSRGLGINNSGGIVGRFYDYNDVTEQEENRRAFVWNSIDGASLLPTLDSDSSAWGINDNGFASGYSTNVSGFKHAVRWDTALATILDIGTLENANHVFGDSSVGYDLNNLEEVVGYSDIYNLAGTFMPYHAFVYDDANGIQDLGTLTTLYPEWQSGYSIAYDRTASGNTVGTANTLYESAWVFRPFIHDATSGMQELSIDPAYPTNEWYAAVINEADRIGGHVIAATNQSLPHYWENPESSPTQVIMPVGFPYGEIYGMNASGQMVGLMWDSDAATGAIEHAFLFDSVTVCRISTISLIRHLGGC